MNVAGIDYSLGINWARDPSLGGALRDLVGEPAPVDIPRPQNPPSPKPTSRSCFRRTRVCVSVSTMHHSLEGELKGLKGAHLSV